jgi:predicted amidophosphoribosyltransferase
MQPSLLSLQLRHNIKLPDIEYCPNCKRQLTRDNYCRGCQAAVKQMISEIKEAKNEPVAMA